MNEGFRLRPRLPRTLRAHLAFWSAGLLFAVLVGFAAFVYIAMGRGLAASIDDSLVLNASQAMAALEVENGSFDLPESFLAGPQNAALRARPGSPPSHHRWAGCPGVRPIWQPAHISGDHRRGRPTPRNLRHHQRP